MGEAIGPVTLFISGFISGINAGWASWRKNV
jgi:hypothetical protein